VWILRSFSRLRNPPFKVYKAGKSTGMGSAHDPALLFHASFQLAFRSLARNLTCSSKAKQSTISKQIIQPFILTTISTLPVLAGNWLTLSWILDLVLILILSWLVELIWIHSFQASKHPSIQASKQASKRVNKLANVSSNQPSIHSKAKQNKQQEHLEGLIILTY